jgi:hypothetical protein
MNNIPNCRLEITKKSFFSSTTRDWNNLSQEIRKEIRQRDRLRKNVFKFGRENDTLKYKNEHEVDFGHLRKATAAS